LIPIPWIYQKHDGGNSGFINFLRILKEVSNDAIYGMEFTGVMIDYIWDFYAQQIKMKIFYPFIALLILGHVYFILIINSDQAPHAFQIWTLEFWLRNIVLLLTALFAGLEVL